MPVDNSLANPPKSLLVVGAVVHTDGTPAPDESGVPMEPEFWIPAAGLVLYALDFAYKVWRDKKRDDEAKPEERHEPPAAAAA